MTIKELDEMNRKELYDYIEFLENKANDYEYLKGRITMLAENVKELW